MLLIKDKLEQEFSNNFFKLILDNPDKNWDWNAISLNPNITIRDISDNPQANWNYQYVSANTFKNDKNNYIKSNMVKYY